MHKKLYGILERVRPRSNCVRVKNKIAGKHDG
jgi:hypothetical protein